MTELTERQRDVLRLMAEGLSARRIAAQLGVSHHTVYAARRTISQRLGTKGMAQMLVKACKEGII